MLPDMISGSHIPEGQCSSPTTYSAEAYIARGRVLSHGRVRSCQYQCQSRFKQDNRLLICSIRNRV